MNLDMACMNQPELLEVETTQLSVLPFKNMKKMYSPTGGFFSDFTSVLFPSGETKIITCSEDRTIQIFDLESKKCEKIINHSTLLCSVHFYKEKQLLMTTDYLGYLSLWDLFSSEIKIKKRIKISGPYSQLWRITQISSNLFFCCVSSGSCEGYLYSIKIKNINENKNNLDDINDIEVTEIKYPLVDKRDAIFCIYSKLKSEKNTILFSGGFENGYNSIKKYNFVTNKHFRFKQKHTSTVSCLISFVNKEYEEIVVSGGYDRKLIFWDLKSGEYLREIQFNGRINCFLNDFRRNNIFIMTGLSDYSIYSLNLKTNKIIKSIDRVHDYTVNVLKWINEKSQNKFISCSNDYSFNVYELQKLVNKNEKEDLKERISFIRDEEFINKYFSFENYKNLLFSRMWSNLRIDSIFKVFLE